MSKSLNVNVDTTLKMKTNQYAERERARAAHLLNDRVRTIGLDLPALASQMEEKSARIAAEGMERMIDQVNIKTSALADCQLREAELEARKQHQKCLAEVLKKQTCEKKERDRESPWVELSEGPASMTKFAGYDESLSSRKMMQQQKQAEWLKQQIFERKVLESTQTVSTDEPENPVTIDRGEIRRRMEQYNKEIAESRRGKTDKEAQGCSTSLPESRKTDFKGLTRDLVREELVRENQRLEKLKEEHSWIESETQKQIFLEAERIRIQKNLEAQKCLEAKREEQIESLRITEINESMRRSREKEAKQTGEKIDASYETDFFEKRFGNSLTCTKNPVNYGTTMIYCCCEVCIQRNRLREQ